MANALDEVSGPVNEEGRDINVISKQIPVKVGVGSTIFEVILWVLGIIPGLVFLIMKIKAGEYFRKLEQRIQHDASQIDNYIEQRVVILQNTAKIMEKAIELDKLISRLMRYAGNCEVVSPKPFREKMQAVINETLANYESE